MDFNIKEIKRQLFHLIAGIILLILLYFNLINFLVLVVLFIGGLLLSVISIKFNIPILSWILDHLDREHDRKRFPGKGALTYLFGCILALLLFERNIAFASIAIMVVGDAIGPLVGIHFGKVKNPINKKKLIEGTLAGFIMASIAALIFVSYKEAILASLVGMVVESLELKHKEFFLNDNITIPLFSGLTIYLLKLL